MVQIGGTKQSTSLNNGKLIVKRIPATNTSVPTTDKVKVIHISKSTPLAEANKENEKPLNINVEIQITKPAEPVKLKTNTNKTER